MESTLILATLILIALAARDIGKSSQQVGLPLISGYLVAGILVGPYVLGVFDRGDALRLWFVDQAALAFIGLAAGGELHLSAARGHLRSLASLIAGHTVVVLGLGALAVWLLAPRLPFMEGLLGATAWAPALLAATIMVSLSPSSAYAIIKELHARGPFTQKVLGVTVLTDAVVIVLFAACVSLANVLLAGEAFNLGLLVLLAVEIVFDVCVGIGVGYLLAGLFRTRFPEFVKAVCLLFIGYGVFHASEAAATLSLGARHLHFVSEPLLVCMTAGFFVANFTRYRAELHKLIETTSPVVFLLFFTLIGLSLELDVLANAWGVMLVLLLVRVGAIFLGSFVGGTVAGDPVGQNALLGMTFLTQAGISVGLAKEIGDSFPPWGGELATLSIALIVANQIVGPPLFKWALHLVGEAHPPHAPAGIDSAHKVIIVGIDGLSLSLGRAMHDEGWDLQLVDPDPAHLPQAETAPVDTLLLPALDLEGLRAVDADHAGTLVVMLPDEEDNYRLCQLAHDHFGTTNLIARVRDTGQSARFRDLGVHLFDPGAALVNLLEILIRSPSTTHLLLAHDPDRKVDEILVRNPLQEGLALRDLELPSDILVISVRRGETLLISHGYTRLQTGDVVSVVGSEESLAEVRALLCE